VRSSFFLEYLRAFFVPQELASQQLNNYMKLFNFFRQGQIAALCPFGDLVEYLNRNRPYFVTHCFQRCFCVDKLNKGGVVIQHLLSSRSMHLAAAAQQLSAPFAKRKPFRIYIGDIIGYGHNTLPERAVDEPEGVAEFMFDLLDQPPLRQGLIGREAIKLLLQPGEGDKRHVPIQLGLTKDKG
jgi:hypothetical protein